MWIKDEKGVWSDGDSTIWIEPETGVIMVKVCCGAGPGVDPEEMNPDQARELSALLAKLADESDALDLSRVPRSQR